MLDNRLQGNFDSKNVVNLFRGNLTGSETSLLSKGLNFVPTSNTIDKAKLKTELEALGSLRLKWHFRNEENEFDLDQFKPKSTFNPRNKDAAIEVRTSSLEEKRMKIEIPKDKYNNLNSKVWLLKWCKIQYLNSEKFLYSVNFLHSVIFLYSEKFLYS